MSINFREPLRTMLIILAINSAALTTGCIAKSSSRIDQLLPNIQASPNCRNCGYVLDGHASRILDGDTIDLATEASGTFRIRLKGIDAPEKSQPFGLDAKTHLTKLIKLINTRQLHVIWSKKDQYGRLIGKLETLAPEEENLCLKMIEAGYAWHYKQFANEQSDRDRLAYAEAEKKAREARRGLWSATTAPIPPWEYRHAATDTKDRFMSDNNDHNANDNSDEERVNRTLRDMAETAFFQELTDLALIRYITELPALPHDPAVFELLTRLNPAWKNDLSTEHGTPTFISIAVPTYVAKDTVAYNRCHCVEEGITDEHMKPCTYCAFKLAIFKSTGDELYRPDPSILRALTEFE